MKPIRKTRHALMFMGAGAVAAYFFDPEAGPERRARLMEQVQSMTGGMGTSSGPDVEERSATSTGSSGTTSMSSSSGAADAAADGAPADHSPIDVAAGSSTSGS